MRSVANSKRRSIMDYLRDTTLAHISVSNGYNTDVPTLKRGLLEMDSPPDSAFPALFITMTQENRENITKVNGQCRLQVVLEGYIKNSTGLEGLNGNLDDFIEDLSRALERDRTLNGLAKWLEVKSVKTDESDVQSYGGLMMVVEIVYVTDQTAP